MQTGSFATISNVLHYIAFYNYTIIGAFNQWCTIVQLTKWTKVAKSGFEKIAIEVVDMQSAKIQLNSGLAKYILYGSA